MADSILPPEGCAFIYLSDGSPVLIDADLEPELSKFKWHKSRGYARRMVGPRGKQRSVWMHRVVNQTPDDMETDHANGVTLDNRRCNLRNCNRQQNCWNTPAKGEIEYKGVARVKDDSGGAYQAHITIGGKLRKLGRFESAREAAFAYDNIARDLHGEFARLNFP